MGYFCWCMGAVIICIKYIVLIVINIFIICLKQKTIRIYKIVLYENKKKEVQKEK